MGLSAKQVAERVGYIGSSDAAAVMGLSRYTTPLAVWTEKTGAVAQKNRSDGELPIWMGDRLEEVVAERFMFETGMKVQRVNEIQVHPKYPFIRAQIDRRVVGEGTPLECKTASGFKAGEWGGDDIPSEYIIQVLHQLMVLGAIAKSKGLPPPPLAHLACLIGGNVDFSRRVIERDEQMIQELEDKEVEFWNEFVAKKIPPRVTAHDAPTLLALFPNQRVDEEPVTLSDDADAIIERIKEIGTEKTGQLQKLLDEKAELENELKMRLGENAFAVVGRWRVTWKEQSSNRLNVKLLGEKEPGIFAKYLSTGKTRVLRISANTK